MRRHTGSLVAALSDKQLKTELNRWNERCWGNAVDGSSRASEDHATRAS